MNDLIFKSGTFWKCLTFAVTNMRSYLKAVAAI